MVVLRPIIRHPFHLFSLGSIFLRRQPAAAAAAAAIIINSNHRSSPSMMMSSSSSTNTNNDNKNDGRIWIHRPFEATPAGMPSSSSLSPQPSSVSMRSCPLPKTTPHSLSKDKIYNIIRPSSSSSSSSLSATKTKTTLLSEQGRPPIMIISPDEIKNMKQIQQSKMEYYKSQFQSRVEDVLTLSSMKRIQRRTIQPPSSSSSSKDVNVTIYFPSEKYNHEKEETTNTDTDANANANKQLPLLNGICLHVHGGGWLFGDSYYQVGHRCLEISQSLNVAVVSVEYNTFCDDDDDDDNTNFQPVNDVITTIDWIESYGCNELNTHRSFIGSGESSGAHLLLLGILNRRDRDCNNKDGEESVLLSSLSSWKCLNLVYGVYDISGTPSVHSDGESSSPLCGKDLLCLYDMYYRYVKTAKQQHTNDDDTNRKHPSMSPLYANLSCLPPVLLTVGTADPLLDDSLFLANKLSSCDDENYVELAIYEGGEHGLGHFGVQEDQEMGIFARTYTLDFMKKYLSE